MTIAVLLVLALQQTATQAPPRPPTTTQPGGATPAQPRRATPISATLEIRVVDRSGRPVADAHVVADGPTPREATSEADGTVSFKTLTAGTYRVRAEAPGFVALEKEIAIKSGAPSPVLISLAAAPRPSEPEPKKEPPPPPAPAPAAATAAPAGEPRALSIPDLAE